MKLAAAILSLLVSAATSVSASETRLSIEGPSGALQGTLAATGEFEAGRHVDVSSMHPALMALFPPRVQGFLIDQMSYDPAQLLARYAGPVLVLQGTTDL